MRKRLYASVFGSGLGHASRMDLVLKQLATNGWQIRVSSFGEGLSFLLSKGYVGRESPDLDVKWTIRGSLDFAGTLRRGPIMFLRFLEQVRFELRQIRQVKPSVIISDSRLSVVLAARILRIPVIVVINQLTILLPRHNRMWFIASIERIGGELLTWFWSLSKVVAIPDLPPPHTISSHNVCSVAPRRNIRFVGFLASWNHDLDKNQDRGRGLSARPLVFCPISGPTQTKSPLLSKLKEIAASVPDYDFVISVGMPGGSTDPRLFRGVTIFEWCPNVEELFNRASVIISRAGHTSIAKAILTGRPLIVIPIEEQTEQIGNAERVQRLGIGVMVGQRDLDPRSLRSAVRLCLNPPPEMEKKINDLRNVALQHDGVAAISQLVEELRIQGK